jgi:hypothetical protein
MSLTKIAGAEPKFHGSATLVICDFRNFGSYRVCFSDRVTLPIIGVLYLPLLYVPPKDVFSRDNPFLPYNLGDELFMTLKIYILL